jgi:hypothetical protein
MSVRRILKRVGNKTFLINVPFLDSPAEFVQTVAEIIQLILEDGSERITEDGSERILE